MQIYAPGVSANATLIRLKTQIPHESNHLYASNSPYKLFAIQGCISSIIIIVPTPSFALAVVLAIVEVLLSIVIPAHRLVVEVGVDF